LFGFVKSFLQMKKITQYILMCTTLIAFLLPKEAQASHAAGAEITYVWLHDSTYQVFYHFYRDCKGIPEPSTVDVCYYPTCSGLSSGTLTLTKLVTLPSGDDNGTEVLTPCPGRPTTCTSDTSTIPGYREWWYQGTTPGLGACDYWSFSHGESARNNAIINLQSPGSRNLYVEATLNNSEAFNISSPYFTVKPVPYICNNLPYTYNNGAYDNNGDSLNFECLNPLDGSGCPPSPSNIPYVTGCSLPSNPLPCSSTFVFSNTTGQMSFTPNTIGPSVITVRANAWRIFGSTWKKVGSVMRDIQVIVSSCNTPLPTAGPVPGTVVGSSLTSGTINACANVPFGFCYDAKTTVSGHILVVKDNHKAFGSSTTAVPTVSYVGMYTDSVRGCFSWTPGLRDTGLKIYTVTITDSTCTGVGIPLSATYAIPIYIWPTTTILSDTTMCPGDSITLTAIGGGGFIWDALSGGSGTSSLSTLSGNKVIAKPTNTTFYTVYSSKNIFCAKNRDTVQVNVVPYPKTFTIDTAACIGSTIQLFVPDTTVASDISVAFKWSPGTYLSNPNVQNPSCTPLGNALYDAQVIYGGKSKCATHVTVSVKALKFFKLLNKDTSVCKNVPISVNASGDLEYYYTWTPATGVSNPNILNPIITADTTRTYTITSHHVACPDSSASFTVTVEQTPLVSAGPDKTICSGDTITLTGSAVPFNSDYIYQWSPDTLVTNPHGPVTVFKGTKTTNMVLEASTPAGCKGSDTVAINVLISKFLKLSPDTGICPGDTANLRATADSIQSVTWFATPYNIDNNQGQSIHAWPSLGQYYTVIGKNQKNCSDTEQIRVSVNPAAIVNLPDSVILYPGQTYQISPEGNCLYYTWSPPYGLNAYDISNPIAQPDVNTRYYAYGVTEAGCKTIDSIDVLVSYDSYINVPNAFTPGSGPGSVLKVLHLGDATLKSFIVFNRWGVKMFETSDINKGWDGTLNGTPQPLGVYVYTVEAYTAKGKRIYKQGNVTLLR
jgi:gliding motility-associated-like protein